MTAVAGSVFTAAQFNTFVRDNLSQTAPAKATTPGAHFAVSDTNEISERVPVEQTIATSETTTSTTFTDLATVGPALTVATGPSALVFFTAEISNNTASQPGRVSIDVSGATTEGADGSKVLRVESSGTAEFGRCSVARLFTTLTPGSNTFKMQYCTVGASTAVFAQRNLIVIPF